MMTNLLEEMQPEVREEAQGQQAKTQKGGTSEISEMRTVTDRPQNKDEYWVQSEINPSWVLS